MNIFSCEIYLQKQCKLFLSVCFLYCCFFVIAELLAVKGKYSRDLSDLSVTSTCWRDRTKNSACLRSLFNYHAIIFVVIEYIMVRLILLQLLNRLCKEQKRINLSFGLPLPNLLASCLGEPLPLASWC